MTNIASVNLANVQATQCLSTFRQYRTIVGVDPTKLVVILRSVETVAQAPSVEEFEKITAVVDLVPQDPDSCTEFCHQNSLPFAQRDVYGPVKPGMARSTRQLQLCLFAHVPKR